jgi:membrane-associated protease RseP (regulator of RpoE activity)
MPTGWRVSEPPPSSPEAREHEEQQVKDPLEQVEVPVIRPRYWILTFILVLLVAVLLFPKAVAIVGVILSLPLIIFLHELAHFVTAKRTGMKVTEFFVGFGPRLWSVQRGETEYGLKAIPLGGYCKIIGMTNLEEVAPGDEPRAYRSKAFVPKVVVASAGSLMHFALALVLMFSVLVVAGNYADSKETTTIDVVEAGGPAAQAGVQAGDRLVAVDGTPINQWSQLRPQLRGHVGDTVRFTVERDGEQRDVPVVLGVHPDAKRFPKELKGVGYAGIAPTVAIPSVGVGSALVDAPREVWDVGVASLGALGDRFSPSGISGYWRVLTNDGKQANQEQADSERFVSVVGFGRLAVQATESGWVQVAYLLILLNVFVGLFNLVPLLPFDGGHIAIAAYEKVASAIRRRPVQVDVAKLLPITAVVMAVLAFVFLSSLFLDITRPIENPF